MTKRKAKPKKNVHVAPVVEATQPEAKPAVKSEAKPVSKAAAKPVAKAEVQPATKPVAKAEVKTETKSAAKPIAKKAAKPVAKVEAKPKAKPKAKPVVKPKAKKAAKPAVAAKEPVQDTIDLFQEVTEAQSIFASNLEKSEKVMNNFIKFNESAYQSSEVVSQKIYDNYVLNVNAMFTNLKALSTTTTATEFYRVAVENNSAAIDRMTDQYHIVSDLTEQAMQETMDASKEAYSSLLPATA